MTAPTERCPRCDQVRAVENGHPGGCLCESCISMCWRDWGVECNAIDWRQRALDAEARADAAEAREAGVRAVVEQAVGDLTGAILAGSLDATGPIGGGR